MKLKFYSVVMALFFVLFGISLTNVEAAPLIRVTPVWRPATQLSTIDVDGDGVTDAGDDIRYVTVDIYATVNVEFWAVGMVCTVNKAVLESYIEDSDPNGTEDDTNMLTNGGDWTSPVQHSIDTIATDGKFTFAISNFGDSNPPMGTPGVQEILHIATLKFRVREDLAAAATSSFTCTTNFLNRDGRKVLTATYVAPPPVSVILGYNFSGNVKYQGIVPAVTAPQAIQITCDDSDGDSTFDDIVTTANITTGAFSVGNLRTSGRYDCLFIPNILNNGAPPDAIHLTGLTDFYLSGNSFNLLPIVLKGGNLNTSAGSTNSVGNADLALVTSNWNAPASLLTAPYMFGDATGDRKINEMDFAVVTSNINRVENYSVNHLIYSLARDNAASFNNHLWRGEVGNASLQTFGVNTSRDYWPAVSPNGQRIAFVRNLGTNGADVFALFTAPITNGLVGAATRISPANAPYDAFAPAWSPDGSQIAFVCSYNDDWADVSDPHGNLCFMEANGQNLRRVTVSNTSPVLLRAKIQSPAWLNNEFLYFAYAADPASPYSSCDNKICSFNLSTLISFGNPNLPVGSDMPYFRNTAIGLTLFYRFDNGAGSFSIRFALLNSFGTVMGAYPTTVGNLHEDVETAFLVGSSISTNVAYYTVSTGADPDILWYEHNLSAGTTGGTHWRFRFFTGTSTAPAWNTGTVVTIVDAISSPAFASGYNEAIPNTAVYLP